MTNQTDQKDKNNRGKMTEEELKTALRPIWQGRQDLNLRHPVLETGALPTELLPYATELIVPNRPLPWLVLRFMI
jgi:hypothetical protein